MTVPLQTQRKTCDAAGGVCIVNIHTFHGVWLLVYYDDGAAWRVRGPAGHRIQRQDYAFGLLLYRELRLSVAHIQYM